MSVCILSCFICFYSLFLQYQTNGYMNEVKNSDDPVQCLRWNDHFFLFSYFLFSVSFSQYDVCLYKE